MINKTHTKSSFPNILLTLFFFFLGNTILAQVPTVQDCLGAIPICTEIYTETTSPSGVGNYPNEIFGTSQGGICCMDNEINSIWYTFTVNQSGNFGFVLTPNDINDDYDWALFNITNGTCADIFNDITMQESCNAAGGGDCDGITGADGSTNSDNQGAGCSGSNSPLNALVPVQQGNTYVLLVSNWTGSTNGYVIDFGVSSNIGIFDNIDPEIDEVVLPGDCGGNEIEVVFSENIQCSTIAGASFEITGPGGPYSITSNASNCSQGGNFDNTFTLLVSPTITEVGNYSIGLVNSPTLPVLDLCDNPSVLSSFNFEVLNTPLTTVALGNDTILCNEEILTIDATTLNAISYEWQDGTASPIYNITLPGEYTVSVTNECNTITDNIFVNFVPLQVIDVELGPDTILCPGQIYELDATWSGGIQYLWQDGTTGPNYTVTESGLYEVMILGACDEIGSAMVEVLYDETELSLNLGVDTLLCEKDGSYILNATDPNALNYEWSDGSTDPTLEVMEDGDYSVIISDRCNVLTDQINLNFTNCTICEFYIPNAFSPNFDGHNDFFRPYSNCVLENYSMKIFNRWGALVFETSDVDTGWNGRFNNKDIAEGVYVYLVEFQVSQLEDVLDKQLTGDVTVVK